MDDPWNRIELLNGQGWIELQDAMPNPGHYSTQGEDPFNNRVMDQAVVAAARTSFLEETKGVEADDKLIRYMVREGHTSVHQQVFFKFRLQAPVLTLWQMLRHRTFSFWQVNSQSGRYVAFEENQFYVPEANEWRLQAASNKQGSDGLLGVDEGDNLTAHLMEIIAKGYEWYDYALSVGVAKEQARIFLPAWASLYTWVVSMDCWTLMNFMRLRQDSHAQKEIRIYADAMYDIFKLCMPVTAAAYDEYILNQKKMP